MSTHAHHVHPRPGTPDPELDRRLEDVGWGLFFVLLGALWLLPSGWVPEGAALIGIGVLLLALNAYRRYAGIPVHLLSTALGALALAAGLGEMAGAQLKLFPLFLVVVGAAIVLKPLLARLAHRG